MNSSIIIATYLERLNQEQKEYPIKDWYKTYLANKHRFYPNTERLLKLIQNKPISIEKHSNFAAFKNSLFFLLKFGFELFFIKKKENNHLINLKALSKVNIVKTFSYDHSFNKGIFTDPFLGDLHLYLKEKKRNVVIVHEHLGQFKTYHQNKITNATIINLYSFISWKDYFFQYLALVKNTLSCHHKTIDPISNFISYNFSQEKISSQFYLHEMHFCAFKNMMKYFDISKIYSSFENNAWEKMLILAKNEISAKTQIIAHQHVPIAPSALNYYLTNTEINILPDRIVTVGKILRNFLISLNYPADKVKAGCALRLKLSKYPLPKKNHRLSLVALDGIPQAAVALNSILKNIDFFKSLDWKFIVRFHPVLDFDRMSPYLIAPLLNYDIFEISKASLEEDILRTDSVFYWGSSVAFEAMYSGRIVIHTPGDEILSNDPITLNGGLHFIANDMEKTIHTILNMSEKELIKRELESIEYCQEYFGVPGPETLESFD